MIPIISKERLESKVDLWAIKVRGDFTEGAPSTAFFAEGAVEVKELGGHLRVFFRNIKLVVKAQKAEDSNTADDENSEESSEDEAEKKRKRDLAAKQLFDPTKKENIPKLHVFLSAKKPKRRMVDVHKTGTRLRIPELKEGEFASFQNESNYEAPLVDVTDVSIFQGIVLIKLPTDEPITEEPIVYAYAKLQSFRQMKIRSVDALQLSELHDMLAKLTHRQESGSKVNPFGPEARKGLKGLHVYRAMASKAWSALNKIEEDTAVFEEVMSMLDILDSFFIQIQAKRIFKAVDLKKNGKIGITEFENFLIAKDLLAPISKDIGALDAFDELKSAPIDPSLLLAESAANGKPVNKKNKNIDKRRNKGPDFEGLDYATFIEGVQILGSFENDPEKLMAAFCLAGNIKEKDADTTYLSLEEFRKGWAKVADLDFELSKRGVKAEGGLFAEGRNRERLNRIITEREELYISSVAKVNFFVENLKQEHRQKKDNARREREAHRDKLLHEANKFIAERAQEKRLLLKKEQEEKSKKRLEDKILRNKLLIRQQESTALKQAEIKALTQESERLRQDEVKALGLDVLDRSVQHLRAVPIELYSEKQAQMKLTYVSLVDFSHNSIEEIPDNFFYWMSDTRKMKWSQNRLKRLNEELGLMARLQILELNANRLEELPKSIGELKNLQRLDISNNQLRELPNSFGNLQSLKYLNMSANYITWLPVSIGSCFQLEYFTGSINLLKELPEDMEHLVSLTHLDLSSNQIGQLPNNIGRCQALQYLDMSENHLTSIPLSFSTLKMIEYCNFYSNSIMSASGLFKETTNLKFMNLRKNSIRDIGADIGSASSLTSLDVSINDLQVLPLEIGLLTSLIELKLERNHLASIPPELGSCTALQLLDLSRNEIVGELPDTLSLIRSLKQMNISFNRIESIPESVVGYRELVMLNAERCFLRSLPKHIMYLEHLHTIEVPNNQITEFPIHLHRMKSLKKLNLSNNAISLLPRNISDMQFLDELNLSRNRLQALPIEFVDILESVPVVNLLENPWTLLPEKWGRRREGLQTSDAPMGYSLPDALDFLYSARVFYSAAEEIWAEVGLFHHTGRLGLDDFLHALRVRLPNSWHDGLVKYAEHVYFKSKELGIFVKWYSLTEEQRLREAEMRQRLSDKKEAAVKRSQSDVQLRQEKTIEAYDRHLQRRVRQAADQIDHHMRGQQYIEIVNATSLHESLQEHESRVAVRNARRGRILEDMRKRELGRMFEILDKDKPVREEERELQKKISHLEKPNKR